MVKADIVKPCDRYMDAINTIATRLRCEPPAGGFCSNDPRNLLRCARLRRICNQNLALILLYTSSTAVCVALLPAQADIKLKDCFKGFDCLTEQRFERNSQVVHLHFIYSSIHSQLVQTGCAGCVHRTEPAA